MSKLTNSIEKEVDDLLKVKDNIIELTNPEKILNNNVSDNVDYGNKTVKK